MGGHACVIMGINIVVTLAPRLLTPFARAAFLRDRAFSYELSSRFLVMRRGRFDLIQVSC